MSTKDCPKCGGTHFGDLKGNCPLSADYVPSKPCPKRKEYRDLSWEEIAEVFQSWQRQAAVSEELSNLWNALHADLMVKALSAAPTKGKRDCG